MSLHGTILMDKEDVDLAVDDDDDDDFLSLAEVRG